MAGDEEATMTVADRDATLAHIFECSIETILHDLLLEVHREEKLSRMQTAVVELGIRAEKLGKMIGPKGQSIVDDGDSVETKAAVAQAGTIKLKGNPMKQIKHARCPNCRNLRLWYPRVGFNSRPPPDPTATYCKTEPPIIIDKHDVHGQRKKGVKMKGQPKGKGKNNQLRDTSPASSVGGSQTPVTNGVDSFEFKEIDFCAAKCPNKNSHLGDHWKPVNIFATHLNGNCWLKRDRAAMREANAKITGTPKDSRASSPKATATNGTKRKADDDGGDLKKKKKAKMDKRNEKKDVPAPSRLREQSTVADDDESVLENGDRDQSVLDTPIESAGKIRFTNTGSAKKKLPKLGRKG